jgi:hypothetical protein
MLDLRAKWRSLSPEQKVAVAAGIPAVAGFALWQRSRARPATDETPATDESAISDTGPVGYAATGAGAGYDAGALGALTEAWNAGLADVAGTAQEASASARAAQTLSTRQRARLNRQQAAIARLRTRAQRNTARDARQAAQLARLRARQQRQAAAIAALRRGRKKAAGGPEPVVAVAYAPGIVTAGGALGAIGGAGLATNPQAVPQASYTPPAARRAGLRLVGRY